MNMKLMKNLDELLGPMICFIFHIYNSVKKIFVKQKLLPVNKILLIKFFGMGSILMMGLMVRLLRTKFPNVKITILTFASNKTICELTAMFDNVVTVRSDTIMALIRDIVKKIIFLRKEKFDVAIDLEFFTKTSAAICYLAGSRIRVGFFLIQIGILLKMMWRGNLLTYQVYYNQHKHTMEVFLALAKAIGAETPVITDNFGYASIHAPENAEIRIEKILSEYLNRDERLILININASFLCIERRWPKKNFMALTNLLLSGNRNLKLIFIGDDFDASYVKCFFDDLPSDIDKNKLMNLAGKLSLAELVALIKRTELLITNDSGPLHIAASLRKPTVSFFGPETSIRYGPKGKMHTVFQSDAYCSPCLNVYSQKTAPCNGNNVCMSSITVDKVYKVLKENYGL